MRNILLSNFHTIGLSGCATKIIFPAKKIASENNKMFYFLKVTPIESKYSYKKINPDNLATLINNLEEVKSSLKGSDLYKYIEM
jgi:hypothetical protein